MKSKANNTDNFAKWMFYIALGFVVYMPLHIFIAQSASLLTGGLDAWKAAKDIILVALVPLLLYASYRRGLWADKTFRWLTVLGAVYAILHLLFVLFDSNDDTYSAIVASVYNVRLLGFLLLGYIVGVARNGEKHLRWLLTAAVLVATAVAAFGVAQYFLPADLLTHVGYSEVRGVKPLFFIDDRPELPRVMSTLRDPNSLGAYLIAPLLLTAYAFFSKSANSKLFARGFRRGTLAVMAAVQGAALFLTFSRGALIGLMLSTVTLLCIVSGERVGRWLRKFWFVWLTILLLLPFAAYAARESAVVQDYILHAAVTTSEQDPNEKRLTLQYEAVEDIIDEPQGYGPGSAGLVAITNPKGGILTENYYLQIAYEVGWLGLAVFLAILSAILYQLFLLSRNNPAAAVLFAASIGYLFYSLLIHLWSNEALALQWWLMSGTTLGLSFKKTAD